MSDNPYQPPAVEEIQPADSLPAPKVSGLGNVVFLLIGFPIAFFGLTLLAGSVWRFGHIRNLFFDLTGLAIAAALAATGILTVVYGATRSPRILRILLLLLIGWVLLFAAAGILGR